jgi:hypothetical protein
LSRTFASALYELVTLTLSRAVRGSAAEDLGVPYSDSLFREWDSGKLQQNVVLDLFPEMANG